MSANIHVEKQPLLASPFSSLARKSEIEIGTMQMQILWALSRRSMHGYELMKALGAIKGAAITQGTMYPALQRLVELKLVRRTEQSEGMKKKYVYHLTAKGVKTMNESCLEFVKTFYGIFHDFACGKCGRQASKANKGFPLKSKALRGLEEPSVLRRSKRS